MIEKPLCGAFARVPHALDSAMRAIGNGDITDATRDLRCRLDPHTGDHTDLVWQLDDAGQGEMWATWPDGCRVATAVVIRPDCPRISPSGSEACTHFEGHPGGCSFDAGETGP